jgi:catechol O-methyltransferase
MMTFKNAKIGASKQQIEKIHPAPKTLIKFDGYVGAPAIAWGAILRELNGPDNATDLSDLKVYIFKLSSVNVGIARDLIRLAGLDGTVHVIEESAAESLRKLFDEGRLQKGSVDVAFFDHREKFNVPDLRLCKDLGLFRKGSKAIADNTDFPGAPGYLEYVRAGGRQGGTYRYETKSIETTSKMGPLGSLPIHSTTWVSYGSVLIDSQSIVGVSTVVDAL